MSESHVYNMDCMEFMKKVPDKFYDLACVDPPYGINVTGTPGGVTSSSSRSAERRTTIGGGKPFGSKDDPNRGGTL